MDSRWTTSVVVRLLATGALSMAGCLLDAEDDAGGMDTGGAEASDVPDTAYCQPVGAWSDAQISFEYQVVTLVNQARAQPRTCGAESFAATNPLTAEPRLRCAARVHSLDMATRGFFSHDNPDGESPFDRMELAGYTFAAAGENIAAGQPDPEMVVAGWLESPGHCSNIMSPDFVEIGVGYVFSEEAEFPHFWTQVFGTEL